MFRLLLARHGATEWSADHRFQGVSDVSLSPLGRRQAELLGQRLRGESINACYSSNLKRAIDTARAAIAGRKQLDVEPRPELRELHFGVFEGLTPTEIDGSYAREFEEWSQRRTWRGMTQLSPPGGESLAQLQTRLVPFIAGLEERHSDETVLVVCHNGPLRVAVCHWLGLGLDHWWQLQTDHASLTILESGQRGRVMALFNDTCHLRE
ncbi:MAG: histidine phosphatase family protein [Dehalococcoidales bacterium]|nr:histidine phosphatase family protein [Dehalococcoidales bacterium]